MCAYFEGIDWVHLFTCVAPDDVNSIWLLLKRIICNALDMFVSHRRVFVCTNCYPPHIMWVLKRKRYLWRWRYLADGQSRYNLEAVKCKRLIMRYHRTKEQRLLQTKFLPAFYRHVNKKLCNGHRIAPLRQTDSLLVSNDTSKADTFNVYFVTVFTQSIPDAPVAQAADGPVSNNISFTPGVVYKALKKPKWTLSAGPDAIPSVFWASVAAALALPVSILFTSSYIFSKLPYDWKNAIVRPIYRKGDPCIVKNYRPVSLTCTICKVMKRIVKDNLLHFALTNNIITYNQHGFIPQRSTFTQMLDCRHDWCKALDKGDKVDVVLIDFSKAFDVVLHSLLLNKLISLGVCS